MLYPFKNIHSLDGWGVKADCWKVGMFSMPLGVGNCRELSMRSLKGGRKNGSLGSFLPPCYPRRSDAIKGKSNADLHENLN